ncbi:MAG: nucleoside-diphosphate kinase [Candidatus Marinimicrobia bacterium]|nr:nucleoside-diphosphate kinase [Candidatus Neomarinimicrobiota bacterium]|tara:strand:+ start:9266 stop:9673 length:408 start_codon:yes stop_codon:yes gene_type:complete
MANRTFAIIKPDAIENKFMGEIISKIIENKFDILNARLITMSKPQAEGFYAVHKKRPFFRDLVSFMCSGPCMVIELKKNNAVLEWRNLIGATDPKEAEERTIRKLFAENKERNSVHGSDSDENAIIEINYFFKNE